jgi:hypothetical protein
MLPGSAYFLFGFMGAPQHMMSHALHPHASSTLTVMPQALQYHLLPIAMPPLIDAGFFAAGFFAAGFFAAGFFAATALVVFFAIAVLAGAFFTAAFTGAFFTGALAAAFTGALAAAFTGAFFTGALAAAFTGAFFGFSGGLVATKDHPLLRFFYRRRSAPIFPAFCAKLHVTCHARRESFAS